LELWRKIMSIDLDGVFYGIRSQIPGMLENGGGTIVNMASILGQVAIANGGDRDRARSRYTLSTAGADLEARQVQSNGGALVLGPDDELPRLAPESTAAGPLSLAPATIVFIVMKDAANPACR